ncbi:MAG: glucosidase [Dongiaceae bacterium]
MARNAEQERLQAQRQGREDWRLWGPYLAERAWGTVREDYSPQGDAWEHFSHDQARSRAYRWSEDGLGGLCDRQQILCFALALWNGRDPFLKERAFGLTGPQGNHGEDVKESYFYLDATPSHAWLRYLYKYPHAAFPYDALVAENRRRDRHQPGFNLEDTGVFAEDRYWDVEVSYAKAGPTDILVRITAANRGPEETVLHLLPTLWFRNSWSWDPAAARPALRHLAPPAGASWAVEAQAEGLGRYRLLGRQPAELLFTENDSNLAALWGQPNPSPYVKDAFHRRVVGNDPAAVNPERRGTKAAAWHKLHLGPGETGHLDLVLTDAARERPFEGVEAMLSRRRSEADIFFHDLQPQAQPEDLQILRQALAGMIWCKQFFHYDVERWLGGDSVPAPPQRLKGRNRQWKHLKAADILSVPDCWEYPWFAAWDLAFHCGALALIDMDFAKEQIEVLLRETYLHPNGQIPAYEWAFGDANPPVHAAAALKLYRAERVQTGAGDRAFLVRVFNKLLLHYAWWINRKDGDGNNVFEGGFLGLDNISVVDRSRPLPGGYSLKQADATGWMAMFALNMTMIALELAVEEPDYQDIAIQTYRQFLSIAKAICSEAGGGLPLWDPADGFFKDLIVDPAGQVRRVDIYSMVGLIPLLATEVVDRRLLAAAPRFREILREHKGGLFQGSTICACPDWENDRGEHLLALVDHEMLPPILRRMTDEREFLSRYGVRSVSRIHAERRDLGELPGIGRALIDYVPGESDSGLFGGNSNWRGPIWLPVNYALVQALEKFHRFLGDAYRVPVPCAGDQPLTLKGIANLIADRVVDLYRRNPDGVRPALARQPAFARDPHWRDLLLFYEYFHADTGQGLGAAHQTGWTGLIANLVMRRYRSDVPEFWSQYGGAAVAPAA